MNKKMVVVVSVLILVGAAIAVGAQYFNIDIGRFFAAELIPPLPNPVAGQIVADCVNDAGKPYVRMQWSTNPPAGQIINSNSVQKSLNGAGYSWFFGGNLSNPLGGIGGMTIAGKSVCGSNPCKTTTPNMTVHDLKDTTVKFGNTVTYRVKYSTNVISNAVTVKLSTTTCIRVPTPTPTPTPSIDISFPRGGEKLGAGGVYKILWSTKSIPSDRSLIISLVRSGTTIQKIATTRNTGSYLWTIPSTISGSDFRIVMVDSTNRGIIGRSASTFSIITGKIAVSLYKIPIVPPGARPGEKNVPVLRYTITNTFDKAVDITVMSIMPNARGTTATPGDFENIYWKDVSWDAIVGTSRFGTSGSDYNFASIGIDDQSCFPNCTPGLITIPAKSSRDVLVSVDISSSAVPGHTAAFTLAQDFYIITADRLQRTGFPIVGSTLNILAWQTPSPTPSVVMVAVPNGGEQWIGGTTRTISWTASNISPANMFGFRLRKSGQIVDMPTPTVTASSGLRSVSFPVPNYISGNDFRIEIVLYRDSRMVDIIATDQSDQNFTITASSPTPTPTPPTPTPSSFY